MDKVVASGMEKAGDVEDQMVVTMSRATEAEMATALERATEKEMVWAMP